MVTYLPTLVTAITEINKAEDSGKAPKPRAGKKRQTKLDKDGNRPEVSVYAKAYNRVKSHFTCIRWLRIPGLAPSHSTQNAVSLQVISLSHSLAG